MTRTFRWGVFGTAHIVESAFLPALRVAGGDAHAVAGRDMGRTASFARKHGIARALAGYQALVDAPDVDAIYNPLPNSLHAEWSVKAIQAGKAVLCEKPLCASLAQSRTVLEVAMSAGKPLWEAFIFPFHRQQRRLLELIAAGAIGGVREIHSEFHFRLRDRANIRLSPELAGGALNDVGCYPIRFAQLIFDACPDAGVATVRWAPEGVDEEAHGVLNFPNDGRLLFSCGMARDGGTFTRVIGDVGEIRITNPFHARASDTIAIHDASGDRIERLGTDEPTFAEAIRHIHAVLAGESHPQHTALEDSLGTEIGLDLLHRSAISGRLELAS